MCVEIWNFVYVHTYITCEIHAYEIGLTCMNSTINVEYEKKKDKSMGNHLFLYYISVRISTLD